MMTTAERLLRLAARLKRQELEARKRRAKKRDRERTRLADEAAARYENGGYDPAATEAAVQALIPHSPV